jgi:hypothetical protein
MTDEVDDGRASSVDPDDLNECLNIYIEAFNAQNAFEMNYCLRRFDGEYRIITYFN